MLYMVRQLCCRGMCKNFLRSYGQQWNYDKAKFPSHLNCQQKKLVKRAPGLICLVKWISELVFPNKIIWRLYTCDHVVTRLVAIKLGVVWEGGGVCVCVCVRGVGVEGPPVLQKSYTIFMSLLLVTLLLPQWPLITTIKSPLDLSSTKTYKNMYMIFLT